MGLNWDGAARTDIIKATLRAAAPRAPPQIRLPLLSRCGRGFHPAGWARGSRGSSRSAASRFFPRLIRASFPLSYGLEKTRKPETLIGASDPQLERARDVREGAELLSVRAERV
eukprot:2960059-Rhodomonas_salina.1